MKTVSLVQVNFQQGPKELNSYYLPYSIGMIWSYANSFDSVKQNYILDKIIFKRDNIDVVSDELSKNDVIGFSTYVWNRNYNFELAKKIKEKNSNSILIFGGPEMPVTDKHIFEKYSFIDIVVKKEGEIIFKEILENLNDLTCVKGIIINRNGKRLDTANRDRIENLDILESPYLNGFFDRLVESNPNIEWAGTLETNRGCPYQCTFCDWGSMIYSKVKKFNLERVFSEIEWMGKHKCGFIFVTDANFGMFPDRDDLIIDKILEVQEKYGHPYTFTFTWAKNQKKEVAEMAHKLIKSKNSNNGLTISVQTLNEEVLTNIKRKNLNQHKIEEIFSLCEERQVPVLTEIILGLPGETLESWKETIWQLFESGNHNGVEIGQVELLENSEMNLVQKEIYGMRSTTVYDYLGVGDDGIAESIEVVNSTRDIPFDDMIEAQFFNCFITTFHIVGLTAIPARVLRKHLDLSYRDFYQGWYDHLSRDPWFRHQENDIKYYYTKWMTEGKLDHPYLNGAEIHGYNLIYKISMVAHIEKKIDYILSELEDYLKGYSIDPDLLQDIIEFQRKYIVRHDKLREMPMALSTQYNILDYIQDKKTPLNKVKTNYFFHFNDSKDMSSQKFTELLWFGRRRNFGKYIVTTVEM